MAARRRTSQNAERNIRLVLEYDGTEFSGWQRQRGRRTVQQVLEKAVRDITREKASVLASGRTDAGVHAKGLVANFRTTSAIPVSRIPAALNSALPPDVSVLSADEVPLDFHATRDAKAKLYRYRICARDTRPALEKRYSYWVKRPLDVPAMKRAARHLVGTHDFNSFRAEGSVEKNTVRTVTSIKIERSGDFIEILFRGNGFLYMMVRIMVGTLVRVGLGKVAPGDVAEILAARDRRAAGPTAPPRGLCLVEVYY